MKFLTKLKHLIIKKFSDIRIYSGGIILFGNSNYLITGCDQRQILSVLQPGDIVFRRWSHYLGSILVPGYWSHVGIYVGDNSVIHAAGGGVSNDDILTFMRSDSFCVMRCVTQSLVNPALNYCHLQLEKQTPYDWDFHPNNDALYCSELVWNAFGQPFCIRKIEQYVVPDDLFTIDDFKTILMIKK